MKLMGRLVPIVLPVLVNQTMSKPAARLEVWPIIAVLLRPSVILAKRIGGRALR